LFSVIAASDPETAKLFGTMIDRGPEAIAALAPARQAVIQSEIGEAFRAAFVTISRCSPAPAPCSRFRCRCGGYDRPTRMTKIVLTRHGHVDRSGDQSGETVELQLSTASRQPAPHLA
jgi:hypothetical protein